MMLQAGKSEISQDPFFDQATSTMCTTACFQLQNLHENVDTFLQCTYDGLILLRRGTGQGVHNLARATKSPCECSNWRKMEHISRAHGVFLGL